MSRLPVLVAAALMVACGGSVTETRDAGAGGDAAGADSGEDGSTCSIPDAAVYACDAAPPGSAGCPAPAGDPNAKSDPNLYPEGCMVNLPTASTFLSGSCPSPVQCYCQQDLPFDAGLQFVCPL